jgi:hypothetical protein
MGVKLGSNRAAWWGAALLLCACTGGGAPPAPVEDPDMDATLPPRPDSGRSDGGNRDGGGDGASEAGADASGEAGTTDLGPVLELLAPEAESVIVGTTLSARCRVERNPDGEPVNPSSVKIALYAGEETVAFVTQVATSTNEADIFKADVALAAAPHGAVRVECSADDVAQAKHHSSLSVSALVDRGPLISFLNPTENGFVQAGDGPGEDVRVRFKVEPRSLMDDDEGAGVDEVAVTVAGKPVSGIEESSTEEYVYSFGLDFSDLAMFTVIPDTLSIRVDARNVRDPAAAASASIAVGVDSQGPQIVVRAPVSSSGAEPIVSGKVDIILEVQDELAGVDAASVEMLISVLGQSTRRYPTESLGGGRYSTTFEVGEYPDSSSLTLNFVARDNVGIESTASFGIRIDDQPPWVSLVPGPAREYTVRTPPTPNECSGPFDPLGDAPNDGVTVQKAVRLRALAWDRARRVSGQDVLHYALVDQTSVDIVVQHNTDVPLLINSRGIPGGACDAVNLRPAPGQTAPVVIELDAITPTGVAPPGGSIADLSQEPDVSGECTPKGGSLPPALCFNPAMTRIIKHAVPGAFPVVYGINVQPSICTGDYYSNPAPGPLCMVAQARDNAGNVAFSAPIRLCVEYADGEDNDPIDGVDALVSCPPGALNDVVCTDGCVLPTKFGPNAPDRMPSVLRLD